MYICGMFCGYSMYILCIIASIFYVCSMYILYIFYVYFMYSCFYILCMFYISNTLQDCTPLQFLETKTGAPLVVLHPPPVKKLLLSPPFLKTKTGAPFVVLDPPPRTTTVKKTLGFCYFPFLIQVTSIFCSNTRS